jgi:3-phosphoshikimate 1-carboxyvinyltransferase
MTTLTVQPARAGLSGRLRVPGDKSISHRALLLAARAEGRSELRGLSDGGDVQHTAAAIQAFGAEVERIGEAVAVEGGTKRLTEPTHTVDVGNSGTAIRLLTGWAAGLDGLAVFEGDASIARRPMARVAQPLRAMGALIDGREGGQFPPLVIRGGHLHGIDYEPQVASAQVKGAVLLAGLAAEGTTTVRERFATRAHTEELLWLAQADIRVEAGAVTVRPSRLEPFSLSIPGDPSQAAFWVVAACIVPGSDLVVEGVYVGPGRAGFLAVLARMGADVTMEEEDPITHTADIRARYGPLVATAVAGAEVPSLIDEIPVLAVAAAYAEGTSTFADAAELKVKETDRIAAITAQIGGLGARIEPRPDGLVVHGSGGAPLPGGRADSVGDHRIAMAAAVAGLGAAAPVGIDGWEAVTTSYPTFAQDLQRCA